MNESITISCPYCDEPIEVEPEPNDQTIQYVEDCPVCCRPILFTVTYLEEGSKVRAERENE
jgi:hypothetical protein